MKYGINAYQFTSRSPLVMAMMVDHLLFCWAHTMHFCRGRLPYSQWLNDRRVNQRRIQQSYWKIRQTSLFPFRWNETCVESHSTLVRHSFWPQIFLFENSKRERKRLSFISVYLHWVCVCEVRPKQCWFYLQYLKIVILYNSTWNSIQFDVKPWKFFETKFLLNWFTSENKIYYFKTWENWSKIFPYLQIFFQLRLMT